MTTDIKPEHKAWAKHLQGTFLGHEIRIFDYYDDDKTHHIDILTAQNSGGVVAATIGLMEHDQSHNPAVQIFTEILMDCRVQNEYIGNVLSTIAFFVVKDGWKVAPGVVFETMIQMYAPDLEVKHAIFLPPIQWGEGMNKVVLGQKTVYPLLAVPITDRENELVRNRGSEALEQLWTQQTCDVFNWHRASAA